MADANVSPPRKPHVKSDEHFRAIEELAKKKVSQPGLYELLKKPIPVDMLFEIYAVSYPRGKEGGALWHFRPRRGAKKIPKLDGENYVPLITENDRRTEKFFRFFHRTLAHDKDLGDYWATRESPELYQTLKEEWNESNGSNTADALYVNLRTTGSDPQLRMAKLRAEQEFTIGIAAPDAKANYIPTGEGVPSLSLQDLQVSPRFGRVPQFNSLASHDWRETDSALWLSGSLVDAMRDTSKVWLEVHSLLKQNPDLPMATDEPSKQVANTFINYAKKMKKVDPEAENGAKGFTTQGAQWWRLAEIELYRNQRAYHSFDHLLSLLIRREKGISATDRIPEYGPIQEREIALHRWGLGSAGGEAPRVTTPLLSLTYNEAHDTEPLTLEKAIGRITNGERQRLEDFAARVPDERVKALILRYLKETKQYSALELEGMARFQRLRYERMGAGFPGY